MDNDKEPKRTILGKALPKAPTFINGLDDTLEGGFPRGRTTLIKGAAGSGKTLLALEFLHRGALNGEPGIFVGFEESLEHIRENAATLSWDLAEQERQNQLFLLGAHLNPGTVMSGDFSLKGLLAVATGKSKEIGAKRIVIDPLDVILHLYDTPQQVRNEMHALNDWLQATDLSVVLTYRVPTGMSSTPHYQGFFDSLSDCVINMETRVSAQVYTRRLRIVKYRGSNFAGNEYPYVITNTGLHTAPITTVALKHKALSYKITSGNKELDHILDGGFRQASCILVSGLPGSGKTLLGCTLVDATCGQDKQVLYIDFEESENALIENVMSAGVDLHSHKDSGRLVFVTAYPESMGAEEHFILALERIRTLCPQLVVIDAISACERMGGKLASFEYLMRMFDLCKEQGVTLMLINQMNGATSRVEISGNGISSMVDTVIFLNYHEGFGETNRLMQVLKARGSNHSNQKREFIISKNGFEILPVYTGSGDVLTGMARTQQEAIEEAEAQLYTYELETLELQLKKKQLENDLRLLNKRERIITRGDSLPDLKPSDTT